jgi:hypothetical protein
MSGIINGTPGAAPPGDATGQDATAGDTSGTSQLSNPLLQQTENEVEAGLTPQNHADYLRVVVAGMHVALAGGPNGGMAKLRTSPDPIAQAAKGAVALVLTMQKQSKGVMPYKAMIPAGLTLMLKALDFIDRAKIAPVGNDELVRATRVFTDTMFGALGITKQMLQAASQNVHGIINDPAQMAKINMKAGFTQHPMAAKPTPLPNA